MQVFTLADSTARRRRASVVIGDPVAINVADYTVRTHSVAMPALTTECTVGGNVLMRAYDMPGHSATQPDKVTFIGVNAGGQLEASEIARGEFFSYVPGIGCVALWPATDHTAVDTVDTMAWDHAYILASSLSMGASEASRYVRDALDDNQFVIWVVLVASASGRHGGGHKKITCKITDQGMFATPPCRPGADATECTRVCYVTGNNASVAVDNRIVIARRGPSRDGSAVLLYRPFRHADRVWQRIEVPDAPHWYHYDDLIIGMDLTSTDTYNVHALTGLVKGVRLRTIQIASRVIDAFLWGGKLYLRTQQLLLHISDDAAAVASACRPAGDFLNGGIVVARNGDWFLTKKETDAGREYNLMHVRCSL